MFFLFFFLVCILAACGVGALAAVSDFNGMKIPNMYSVLIFLAFVICFGVLSFGGYADVFKPLLSHVVGFSVVFVITLLMFFAGVWGAGDQKMVSAFSIWFGLSGLPVFLVYTTLFGGVLGVAALVLRRWKFVKSPVQGSWVDKVQAGEGSVPYGIAIALGALASFFKMGYLDVEVLSAFL